MTSTEESIRAILDVISILSVIPATAEFLAGD
jgi:hypothetical protein